VQSGVLVLQFHDHRDAGQLILGDNLDTERITASYDAGVLTLQIPVAEQAKPRKITVTSKGRTGRP
jgi:HSP20 family protein